MKQPACAVVGRGHDWEVKSLYAGQDNSAAQKCFDAEHEGIVQLVFFREGRMALQRYTKEYYILRDAEHQHQREQEQKTREAEEKKVRAEAEAAEKKARAESEKLAKEAAQRQAAEDKAKAEQKAEVLKRAAAAAAQKTK